MNLVKKQFCIWLILILFLSVSCSENQEPFNENYFFEAEVEGNVFRQEFSENLTLDELPLVFERDRSVSIGQINSMIDTNCLSSCISPFYINMVFDGRVGTREVEVLEQLQVPIGSFTTDYWYGSTNVTPEPSKISVTITGADESKRVIAGTFEGEAYKNQTQTPVKIPIKGTFKAGYRIL